MSASLDDMSDAERLQEDLDGYLTIYPCDSLLTKLIIENYIQFVCFEKNIEHFEALFDPTIIEEFEGFKKVLFQHTQKKDSMEEIVLAFLEFVVSKRG